MEKLLDSVMDIGEQMLINGAVVHRVEDSIKKIFDAYGTKRTDVFIITSSIAGLLRTIEACITAFAIAAGYFAVAFITGGAI